MSDVVAVLSAAAWPIAVVFLLGWRFRTLIERVGDRIQRIGVGGTEVHLPQPAGSNPSSPTATMSRPPQGPSPNPVVRRHEEAILRHLNERVGESAADRERALIGVLARSNVELNHERNYIVIFGSQIAALRHLNALGSAPTADIMRFYETARSRWPPVYEQLPFERWLDFLRSAGLIEAEGDRVSVSDAGRDFLQYLTGRRYFEDKSG